MLTLKKTILFTRELDDATRKAAERQGVKQSDWIREACLARLPKRAAADIRDGFTSVGRPPSP